MRYAGFNKRSWAYTIDATIVTLLTFFAGRLFGKSAAADELTDMVQQLAEVQNGTVDPATLDYSGLLNGLLGGDSNTALYVGILISAVYNIFFVTSRWQATPGKRWCKIKIVMADGLPVDLKTSIIRHVTSALSYATLLVGFAMAGWTKEKTALHDIIAGTRVIYKEEDA